MVRIQLQYKRRDVREPSNMYSNDERNASFSTPGVEKSGGVPVERGLARLRSAPGLSLSCQISRAQAQLDDAASCRALQWVCAERPQESLNRVIVGQGITA